MEFLPTAGKPANQVTRERERHARSNAWIEGFFADADGKARCRWRAAA
jgi:hypothetical protein